VRHPVYMGHRKLHVARQVILQCVGIPTAQWSLGYCVLSTCSSSRTIDRNFCQVPSNYVHTRTPVILTCTSLINFALEIRNSCVAYKVHQHEVCFSLVQIRSMSIHRYIKHIYFQLKLERGWHLKYHQARCEGLCYVKAGPCLIWKNRHAIRRPVYCLK
jgi:hypothetical protein